MFSFIVSLNDNDIDTLITGLMDKPVDDDRLKEYRFEVKFIKRLLIHANRLLEDIGDNALTVVIKKQIIKISALLVSSTNTKLNGLIDRLSYKIDGLSLDDSKELKLLKQSPINEYTVHVTRPTIPLTVLSQIGGISASCGLHAVMHMFMSMGFTSNFFDFTDIMHQKCFAHGFNKLNNGEMCTVMSEINDVLRSFTDTLAAFVPPTRVYSMVGTKGSNDYNLSDFLKPSIKVNFGIDNDIDAPPDAVTKKGTKMTIKESFIYDISKLSPTWMLFDIGMWCTLLDGIVTELNVSDYHYRLHSFIVNTGLHYVCCVMDKIHTERGPVEVVRIYDDLSFGHTRIASLNSFGIDQVGVLLYHKI